MSRNFNDLSKQVFGKLTVIEKVNNISKRKTSNHVYWKCLCKCGKEVIVRGTSLTSGNTKSCGCIKKDYAQIRNKRFNNYDFSKTIALVIRVKMKFSFLTKKIMKLYLSIVGGRNQMDILMQEILITEIKELCCTM